ncbi:MAG: hypothetical protein KME11_12935 [Timaviella obliquedivisa GSE-PSE-MK23-08B]|jgi:hypothetical protein|nr:hypothetical protein [Timaviella obliquedivisa GSE-PSE-MK23-08B]
MKINLPDRVLATTSTSKTAPAQPSFFYTAYGINICSDILLPELVVSANPQVDAIVQFGVLSSPLDHSSAHSFQMTPDGMYLFWQEIGTFLIRNGKEIIIDPLPEADESRLRLFILGAAMGVLLHQRGHFILHASAVAIHGAAVVFTGDKGWGKSTIAAALCQRGHRLLADDVVALTASDSEQQVIPAFPQLKLWLDAVTFLGNHPDDFPPLVPHLDKRDCRLTEEFINTVVPLQHIFVLGRGDKVEIQRMPPQEVLLYLMRNSYITRFGEELLKSDRATHFLKLTQLSQQVAIWRLLRPNNLSQLTETAEFIEAHIAFNC